MHQPADDDYGTDAAAAVAVSVCTSVVIIIVSSSKIKKDMCVHCAAKSKNYKQIASLIAYVAIATERHKNTCTLHTTILSSARGAYSSFSFHRRCNLFNLMFQLYSSFPAR